MVQQRGDDTPKKGFWNNSQANVVNSTKVGGNLAYEFHFSLFREEKKKKKMKTNKLSGAQLYETCTFVPPHLTLWTAVRTSLVLFDKHTSVVHEQIEDVLEKLRDLEHGWIANAAFEHGHEHRQQADNVTKKACENRNNVVTRKSPKKEFFVCFPCLISYISSVTAQNRLPFSTEPFFDRKKKISTHSEEMKDHDSMATLIHRSQRQAYVQSRSKGMSAFERHKEYHRTQPCRIQTQSIIRFGGKMKQNVPGLTENFEISTHQHFTQWIHTRCSLQWPRFNDQIREDTRTPGWWVKHLEAHRQCLAHFIMDLSEAKNDRSCQHLCHMGGNQDNQTTNILTWQCAHKFI